MGCCRGVSGSPDTRKPDLFKMPILKPFRRNCRPFVNGSHYGNGNYAIPRHPKFAKDAIKYIRAFLLLQKDALELFDYIEPSDQNFKTYSFRLHELLLRSCIEIETNFKAILRENGYRKADNWNIADYKKIDATHRLSSYQIKLPQWDGENGIRTPFKDWRENRPLRWYQAYNEIKHDRHEQFASSTFENFIDAICALTAVIYSQFLDNDFGPDYIVAEGAQDDGFETSVGGYFRIKFPTDWPDDQKYAFNWQTLQREAADPFQEIGYN